MVHKLEAKVLSPTSEMLNNSIKINMLLRIIGAMTTFVPLAACPVLLLLCREMSMRHVHDRPYMYI